MDAYYNLSKDYKKLFEEICKGNEIVAFVDNRSMFDDSQKPLRDVCSVKRWGPWLIYMSCRGTNYGHVYDYMKKDGRSEEDTFIIVCKSINLGWICVEDKLLSEEG